MRHKIIGISILTVLLAACQGKDHQQDDQAQQQQEQAPRKLIIYSARNEQLIKPLIDLYQQTQDKALEIEYLTDEAPTLMARLEAEGESSPADLLITVDVGNLWQAEQKSLLSPVDSQILKDNIPEKLRQVDGKWFGLSVRARTIVYSIDRIDPSQLSTYEDLADPKWQGKLCLRTSKKVYNQSLVASLIANLGEEKAEAVVKGWVNNLATDVFSNDTQLMEAIMAGQCDVGIVNTYYYGRLMKEKPEANIALFWPNQADRGVHINISGGGVTQYAKNRVDAVAFLEWLSTEEAQRLIADENQEYPANPAVKAADDVSAWGDFKQDELAIETAGKLQEQAIKLMDRVGYH